MRAPTALETLRPNHTNFRKVTVATYGFRRLFSIVDQLIHLCKALWKDDSAPW